MFDAVIKVGGSLYGQSELQASSAAWVSLAAAHRLLFLPGGGPFADQVRAVDAHVNLSDSAAHWMAILAMDQFAYLLADFIPGATLVRDLTTAAKICARGQLPILAPSALLLQLDPLPHSWQITSDSISAWLANHAGIQLLVLLKSVTGAYQADQQGNLTTLLPQISKQTVADHGLVDPYFAQTLSPSTLCWMIDGRQPERLAELLNQGSTLGTQIVDAQISLK